MMEFFKERPTGVTITAVVLMFYGAVTWFQLAFGGPGWKAAAVTDEAFVIVTILCVAMIGAGISLFVGARWSWWLTCFVLAFSFLGGIVAMIMSTAALMRYPQLVPAHRTLASVVFRRVFGILMSLVLYLYFMRSSVREHFGSGQHPVRRVVALNYGVGALVLVVGLVLSALVGR